MVAAALILGASAAAYAHEVGTTRVDLSLDAANHYRIQIVTDASALAEKLDAMSGRMRELTMDASELRRRLAESTEIFLTRAHSDFAVASPLPAVDYAVAPGTDLNPPLATITLQGTAPAGASRMTWFYGWTFTSYALTLHCDGCPEATDTVDGGQASRAIALRTVDRPALWRLARPYLAAGFSRVLPHGVVPVLFVVGLFLVARRRRDLVMLTCTFIAAQAVGLGVELSGSFAPRVSPSLLQTLLILSVVYVTLENTLPSSRVACWCVVPIVGGFGAAYGLSLARTLGTVGFPSESALPAAAGFAAGACLAQLTVALAAFVLIGPRWNSRLRLPSYVTSRVDSISA